MKTELNNIDRYLNLPEIKPIKRISELDFYGFSRVLAKISGYKKARYSFGNFFHGWIYLPLKYPEQILINPNSPFTFVNNKEQELFLNSKGYNNVKAAGLPILYTDFLNLPKIKRVQNSLLVMPGHTLKQQTRVENHEVYEKAYIDYIKQYFDKFEKIVFCISRNCLNKGMWHNSLENENISYIEGANSWDANALIRMRNIFSSFEYMTTNRIGSHVLYASYFGCKVTINEKNYDFPRINLVHSHNKNYPNRNKLIIENETLNNLKKWYPQFFLEPYDAQLNIEWAKKEIGVECLLDPKEILNTLGWNNYRLQLGYIRNKYINNKLNNIRTKAKSKLKEAINKYGYNLSKINEFEDYKTKNHLFNIKEIKDNDVFIVGFPESGNTRMQKIVAGLIYDINPEYLPHKLAQEIIPDIHMRKYYKRFSNKIQCFKSHHMPRQEYKRVIYIVRDGRDAMCSYYAMNKAQGKETSLEEMLKDNKEVLPCSWWDHVFLWNRNPFDADIVYIRYEDLICKPLEETKKICDFLNIERNKGIHQRVINGASFLNFKNMVKQQGPYNINWNPGEKIGTYKEEMPNKLQNYFVDQAKNELILFGYII